MMSKKMSANSGFRIEKDFLGSNEIPNDAYWGIHSLRAAENFPITGTVVARWPSLIKAIAQVKKAAATVNFKFGVINERQSEAIIKACDDVIAGKLNDQFIVDVIQGGAGTSTNMNSNEVIANRDLEYLGFNKGEYEHLHPNDHVNASQSTNDVYPTALKVATWYGMLELLEAMRLLRMEFERKAEDFKAVLKIGRTQLQDAVPMTLGQEFMTYAVMIGEDEQRLAEATKLISEVNLGATAIGTEINTPIGYSDAISKILAQITGLEIVKASNLIEATQDTGSFVQLSGTLKRVACKLSKICNDLRLLSSGPQAGFCEIFLPARQAGSSIMPGTVNPVIPEVVNQVAFEVIGNDVTITMASEAGQLQLNAFEPIMGWSLHKSISHLTSACTTLRINCVAGIEPNYPLLEKRVSESVTLATALCPTIGYERSAQVAKRALANGETIAEAAEALGFLTGVEVGRLTQLENLTGIRK